MAGLEESYGLVVGIANYLGVNRLPSTVLNDAHDVYDLLCSPDHCGYLEEHVRVLLDGEATARWHSGGATMAWRVGRIRGHGFRILLWPWGSGRRGPSSRKLPHPLRL